MNYTFFIARRYFRKGRVGYLFLTHLFAIISVAVGVASLILVLGVMNGFDRDLRKKIIGVLPPITVQLPDNGQPWEDVQQKLSGFPEVLAVAPFSETQVILRSRGFLTAGLVRAIDPAREDAVTDFNRFIVSEAKPKPGEAPVSGLILGAELARSLGVGIGDRIEIITGFGAVPGSFPVRGIFRTGLYHFDVSIAFIPLAESGGIFRTDGRPQALGLKSVDIYSADQLSRRIANSLGPGYRVESWIDKNRTLFAALALERRAMAAILILIILVAGFNITTSLMMTVWRKSKEIGVLRSIGVSRGGIRSIFLWMGVMTGFWGVAAGLTTGLSLAYIADHYRLVKLPGYVYDLSYLPIKVQGTDVIWITVTVFIIALVASIFPAQEAARVAPAVTLRGE